MPQGVASRLCSAVELNTVANSLLLLPLRGGVESHPPTTLNSGRLCDYFDQQKSAEVMLCQCLGSRPKRLVTSTLSFENLLGALNYYARSLATLRPPCCCTHGVIQLTTSDEPGFPVTPAKGTDM